MDDVFCNYIFICVFTTGLQNDHKSIMKLIEEKIHQLHEEARNKQNVQTNKGIKARLSIYKMAIHMNKYYVHVECVCMHV